MYSFKILRLIFGFLVIFFSSQLFGQTDTTKSQFKKYALQFQIDNNFTLDSFKGTVISLKRNFSDRTAIRFGLSLQGQTRNSETRNYLLRNDITLSNDKTEDDLFDFSFSVQYLFYPIRDEIIVFFGGGPTISYYYRMDKNETAYDYSSFKRLGFGLSFPIGVEWYFKKNMSLSAEYGLTVIYFLTNELRRDWRNSYDDYYTQDVDTKSISVFDLGVLFGLSVYF